MISILGMSPAGSYASTEPGAVMGATGGGVPGTIAAATGVGVVGIPTADVPYTTVPPTTAGSSARAIIPRRGRRTLWVLTSASVMSPLCDRTRATTHLVLSRSHGGEGVSRTSREKVHRNCGLKDDAAPCDIRRTGGPVCQV